MKKFNYILPVILLGLPVFLSAQQHTWPEDVLNQLYKTNGNKMYLMPTVKIVNDEKNAACFLRQPINTIEVSKRLLEVCRAYGKDSSSALAFVIAHELSHAFQSDLNAKQTSFLAYNLAENSSIANEKAADVSGAFLANQAGFKSTLSIMEALIEKIYKEFGLKDNLVGYPSLEERKKTAIEVKKMVFELINAYEIGNYLTAMGHNKDAIRCYEYISKWYRGREIFNNIGLNYALLAINFTNKNIDKFIYPLELNWSTRMKKPIISRGEVLTIDELALRQEYLNTAEKNLVEASRMDPQLFIADVNIMCVLLLKGKAKGALDYCRDNELNKRSILIDSDSKSKDQLKLALALSHYIEGEIDKAKRIWTEVSESKNIDYADQAKLNLNISNGIRVHELSDETCVSIPNEYKTIDGIKLHKIKTLENIIELNESEGIELSYQELPHSTIFLFKNNNSYLKIQRIPCNWNMSKKSIRNARAKLLTTDGAIYHCEQDRCLLLLDKNSKVIELIKYE